MVLALHSRCAAACCSGHFQGCRLPPVLMALGVQGARGPVQATLCENWAVYHFWSLSHHRFEMAVIELYDASPRDLSITSVLFGASNDSTSSFIPPPIEVRAQ